MRIAILTTLTLALTLTAACSKKDGDGAASGASADKAEPAAAAGPLKTTPQALWTDFTDPKVDGMKLLDKYRAGATFTGTIKIASAQENGDPILFMDVDGSNNKISLDFTDKAAIKAKAPKVGDSLTVTCQIGGASGALMMATDCKL
jgi:hypothetical protein